MVWKGLFGDENKKSSKDESKKELPFSVNLHRWQVGTRESSCALSNLTAVQNELDSSVSSCTLSNIH
jgi:transcription initiation factor TFIIIB Brf1 subunit/transcription initiation factor TFIIB